MNNQQTISDINTSSNITPNLQLSDLPHSVKVLIVQQIKNLKELLEIRLINNAWKRVVDDEEVWFHRIQTTFELNFAERYLQEVGRKKSYQMLFRALQKPQVFVWGQVGNSRLGLSWDVLRSYNAWDELVTPVRLDTLSGKGVAKIICGGWMMLALNHEGEVYFWGTFNPESFVGNQSLSIGKPTKLDIFQGEPIQQLVCGRAHAVALSSEGSVFEVDSFSSSTKIPITTKIKQLAAGWGFTLALLEDNTLIKWDQGRSKNHKYNNLTANLNEDEKFIKVAGGQGFSMALTDQSRVIYWIHIDHRHDDNSDDDQDGDFETGFEDEDEASNDDNGGVTQLQEFKLNREELGQSLLVLPNHSSRITHLNVHFLKFALMTSDGQVWLGEFTEDPIPTLQIQNEIKQSLQNQGVCQVSFGDWHQAALLENGELLTWGEHALGHQQSRLALPDPKKVAFFENKYFVFYVSCAGWHTAALAVEV